MRCLRHGLGRSGVKVARSSPHTPPKIDCLALHHALVLELAEHACERVVPHVRILLDGRAALLARRNQTRERVELFAQT